MNVCRQVLSLSLGLVFAFHVDAQESGSKPKEIPTTRSTLKSALERTKQLKARLPLPPPNEQEQVRPEQTKPDLSGEVFNSARLKQLYLHQDLLENEPTKTDRMAERKIPI